MTPGPPEISLRLDKRGAFVAKSIGLFAGRVPLALEFFDFDN
jgi:hypothetical protein